ncbi:MAG: hypothetical protein KKB90_02965 [Actinobacteria bacterium]|nr:hypothetical protein [Actinomycetota bacterium]MCG2817750.1 hypothetical protein [Actinomycetes bacterium]MBU4178486.1 hypothetical protein [Actinomycetota bacterium]MBU4217905.1 hypothetical protein [Actinomycetota bacterium]MBU4360019.1 hypothetical protein [Actinomycetota bacterium]
MNAEQDVKPGAFAGAGVETAATAMVLGYGVLLDRVLPELSHVPVNVAAAALAVFLAGRAGAFMDDMGLDLSRLESGLKVGLLSVAPIAAVVAVGVTSSSLI